MDLIELSRQFPDLSVTVRLGDLVAANERLVRKVRRETEQELERRRLEYGDVLIPKEEARRMLGNPSPTTLWRWENRDYLHPVRIGVRVHYKKSEIDSILKKYNEIPTI